MQPGASADNSLGPAVAGALARGELLTPTGGGLKCGQWTLGGRPIGAAAAGDLVVAAGIGIPAQLFASRPDLLSHETCENSFEADPQDAGDACGKCVHLQRVFFQSALARRNAVRSAICRSLSPPDGGWCDPDRWRCGCELGGHPNRYQFCPVTGKARDAATQGASAGPPPSLEDVQSWMSDEFVEALIRGTNVDAKSWCAHSLCTLRARARFGLPPRAWLCCVCMHVRMFACMHVFMCTHTRNVQMCAFDTDVRMFVCMHVCMCAHTHTHTGGLCRRLLPWDSTCVVPPMQAYFLP